MSYKTYKFIDLNPLEIRLRDLEVTNQAVLTETLNEGISLRRKVFRTSRDLNQCQEEFKLLTRLLVAEHLYFFPYVYCIVLKLCKKGLKKPSMT